MELFLFAAFIWLIGLTIVLSNNSRESRRAVQLLENQIRQLHERLRFLEQERGPLGDPLEPAMPEPPTYEEPPMLQFPADEPSIPPSLAYEPPPAPIPPQPAPSRPAPPQPAPPPRPPVDWQKLLRAVSGPLAPSSEAVGGAEARLGMYWLSRVGALLLVIGAFFAFRYAISNPVVKVLVGYLAGLGLIGVGFWGHRRQYRTWGQAVTGGGLGILYLATTAAGTAFFFDQPVIPLPIAFGIMCLVTTLGTGLAIWYDSMAVGLLGLVGGFATPFVFSQGQGDFRILFGYMLLLDIGLLLVAYFRRWPLYNYLVLAATWAIYGLWRAASYRPGDEVAAFIAITGFFLVFVLVAVAENIVHRRSSRYPELALALANGFIYFAAGLDLLWSGYAVARGLFAFAAATVYLGLGTLALRRNRADRLLILGFLGLAAVFLTIAFPVALKGPWITVAWALEGAMLVWLGFLATAPLARRAGLLVLSLAAGRLMLLDTMARPLPHWSLRAFTFLAAVGAYYLAAHAFQRYRGNRWAFSALAVAGNFFTLWYITWEIVLAYGHPAAAGRDLAIASAWGLYGLLLALVGYFRALPAVRHGARVLLGVALLYLVEIGLMLHAGHLPVGMRWFAYASVLGSAWVAELLAHRRDWDQPSNGWLSIAGTIIAFGLVAFETLQTLEPWLRPAIGVKMTYELFRYHDTIRTFAVIAAWGAFGLLVMLAGILVRTTWARRLAGGFLITAMGYAAVGAFELTAGTGVWRLLAFLLTVPGTYLAVFAASRLRDRPQGEALWLSWVALAAALLTAWWGSAEIYAFFGGNSVHDGRQGTAALAWLGLYALAVGVTGSRLRSLPARWLGLGLQGVTLIGLLVVVADAHTSLPFKAALFAGGILGIYASHYLVSNPNRSGAERTALKWLSLAACAATILWLGLEIRHGGGGNLAPVVAGSRTHWILLSMGTYGLIVLAVGLVLRSLETRALGFGIIALGTLGTFTAGVYAPPPPLLLALASFALTAGAIYAATLLLRRHAARCTPLEVRIGSFAATATAALTVEWLYFRVVAWITPFLHTGTPAELAQAHSTLAFGISGVWAAYGFIVLILGFVLRSRTPRLLGLGVLALTLVKIASYDMWRLEDVSQRIWITLGLGGVLVAASLLYQRLAARLTGQEVKE